MSGPGYIGKYINDYGYAKYVRENSKLFFENIYQRAKPCVGALSSGFMIAEVEIETVEKKQVRGEEDWAFSLAIAERGPSRMRKYYCVSPGSTRSQSQ